MRGQDMSCQGHRDPHLASHPTKWRVILPCGQEYLEKKYVDRFYNLILDFYLTKECFLIK